MSEQPGAVQANLDDKAMVLAPGDMPTLRSLAEDAMVRFDIARWLATGRDTADLAAALTDPWGDA